MADALPAEAAGAGEEEPPRVGRPRDPRVDAAVRSATLQLLVERGYGATSIQAIARRAGVSAPAIYRRWSSKAQLVEEVVFPTPFIKPTARSGDVQADLATYCVGVIRHLGDPAVRAAIPGLLTEYQTDPALWQALVRRTVAPMREQFAAFLAQTRRQAAGSPDVLFDVMIGSLFVRAINSGAAGAEAFAAEVARIVARALVGEEDRPR